MSWRSMFAIGVGALAWAGVAAAALPAAENAVPAVPGTAASGETAAPPQTDPYVGIGKRDPFRPFTLDLPEFHTQTEPLTPLQKFELGQLKLAGTVLGIAPAAAMVEDSSGMGYIVTVGTPIGRNDGVVTKIETGKIVVEERGFDFYGQEHLNTVVLAVPSDDGGEGQSEKKTRE